jgi:site-specific recombinase XerD
MEKYLNHFLNYIRVEKNLSQNTIVAYRKDIEQYFNMCNIKGLEQLDKFTIRDYLSKISKLAPTSRRRKLSALRAFMGFLSSEGIIEKNFASEIENAKIDKRLPKVLSVNETASIIDSANSIQDRAILETLYGLGCRVSELVNIKVSDIEFDDRTVRLFGKGNKERIVPINNASLSAIIEHLNTRGFNSEYVFASRVLAERPMTTKNVSRVVAKYSEAHPHMFRHSYATHLHANGVDINVIKDLLGHADISTTTIYTHVANEQMTRAYRHAHPRG